MFIYLFIWLCRVLVAACRLLCSCGARALECAGSVVVACELSCPVACGFLVPWPGIEPTSPALEGGFLTTGPRGKSVIISFDGRSCFSPILGVCHSASHDAYYVIGVYLTLHTNYLIAGNKCPSTFSTSSINNSVYLCYISCSLMFSTLKQVYGSIKIASIR